MRRGGQPAVWAAGIFDWSHAKTAYTFTEELLTSSTQYRTAVLEVHPDARTWGSGTGILWFSMAASCLAWSRSYHPVFGLKPPHPAAGDV